MTATIKHPEDMTPDELAKASAAAMWSGDNATRGLNMELTEVGPGMATVTMTVTDKMLNGHGTCHGGYIFTLADSAFAFACNSYNQTTVGQHCSISYLAPGKAGERLTATCQEVNRAGRSGIYDVKVFNPAGECIAEFRGHSRTIKGTLVPTQGD